MRLGAWLSLFGMIGVVATAAPVGLSLAIAHTPVPKLQFAVSTEIRDRNGDLLHVSMVEDGRWRLDVDQQSVDPRFVAMLLNTEDRGFYIHHGVEVSALARAAGQVLLHGHIRSGGSTLSMQVARLAARLETRTLWGKITQIVMALALERQHSKAELLNAYLRLAPYGGNIEGVASAARVYFSKAPYHLTAAEQALLVAIPQAPESRRPDKAAIAAKAARDRILSDASKRGVLARDEAREAQLTPVPTRRVSLPQYARHIAARVMAEDPGHAVYNVTLDRALQAGLKSLALAHVRPLDRRVSAALVVVDHRSGEILAYVGSADPVNPERKGFIDMVRAVRSPGSTLKPFIYGLAFEEGLAAPETLVEDRPTRFGAYAPINFDGVFHGTVSVREALLQSLNIPAIDVLDLVGPERLLGRLRRAGVTPAFADASAPGLAVGLGGIGLTLLDLSTLYSALAEGGRPVALHWRRDHAVSPKAPLIIDKASQRPVMVQGAAAAVAKILLDQPSPVGSTAVRVAYKTGTSYGYRDAWAIGFNGAYVVGVWVGRADATPVFGLVGREVAVPLMGDIFARLPAALSVSTSGALFAGVPNGQLPPALRRLHGSHSAETASSDDLSIAFPQNGAHIDLGALSGALQPMALKAQNGSGPFTWFADGAPIAREDYARESVFQPKGAGFVTLTVVDGQGRAARSTVFVE